MKFKKATLPKGTRDFGAESLWKRNYLLDIIRNLSRKYGFLSIETPAIEALSTLDNSYGEEGNKLIFRILNSGDFLKGKLPQEVGRNAEEMQPYIASKGLRYDLTVPLARYIQKNNQHLAFPFKRVQIAPVWRADRPQKGRYCEFLQGDLDIVGSDSPFCEAELLALLHKVFEAVGLKHFVVKVNHRGILNALSIEIGMENKQSLFINYLDKEEKIGREALLKELQKIGLSKNGATKLTKFLDSSKNRTITNELANLEESFENKRAKTYVKIASQNLLKILSYITSYGISLDKIVWSAGLARGMEYYTGTIFEVASSDAPQMGSIAAGGRYDHLTGMPSVGLSFGIERLYDILLEQNLSPPSKHISTMLLLLPIGKEREEVAINFLAKLRQNGISSELFPSMGRAKKGFSYADKKKIPFVAVFGEQEGGKHALLKQMDNGEEHLYSLDKLINLFKSY